MLYKGGGEGEVVGIYSTGVHLNDLEKSIYIYIYIQSVS